MAYCCKKRLVTYSAIKCFKLNLIVANMDRTNKNKIWEIKHLCLLKYALSAKIKQNLNFTSAIFGCCRQYAKWKQTNKLVVDHFAHFILLSFVFEKFDNLFMESKHISVIRCWCSSSYNIFALIIKGYLVFLKVKYSDRLWSDMLYC